VDDGDPTGYLADPALDQILYFRAEAARGPADMQCIGNDIVGRPAFDKPNANHRRIERIDASAGDRLQRQHHLRADDERVNAEMRVRGVGPMALDPDVPTIGGGQ
jgi:hypothetical protein